jgi:hypothetical protein
MIMIDYQRNLSCYQDAVIGSGVCLCCMSIELTDRAPIEMKDKLHRIFILPSCYFHYDVKVGARA